MKHTPTKEDIGKVVKLTNSEGVVRMGKIIGVLEHSICLKAADTSRDIFFSLDYNGVLTDENSGIKIEIQ